MKHKLHSFKQKMKHFFYSISDTILYNAVGLHYIMLSTYIILRFRPYHGINKNKKTTKNCKALTKMSFLFEDETAW